MPEKTTIESAYTTHVADDQELSRNLAVHIVKETKNSVNDTQALVDSVREAREALDELTDSWKASWIEWLERSKTILTEFRQWRMAMNAESKIVTQDFAEVRKFFLSKDHEEEIRRLSEFVNLCERLQALKSSGFLDTITETILKLDE